MKQYLRSARPALHGALATLLATLCAGCMTTADGQQPAPAHPLLHCKKEVAVFNVLVTGLVKFPGWIPIPPGGLILQDAVGLAGGDQPAQQFPGTNPANVLVSLKRPAGTYHFSLPLVTNDVAGRIYLKPGDHVVVEPVTAGSLGRSFQLTSVTDPVARTEVWRSLLRDDAVGTRVLAYDIPFIEQNDDTLHTVTVTIQPTAAPLAPPPGAPREAVPVPVLPPGAAPMPSMPPAVATVPAPAVSPVQAIADFGPLAGPVYQATRGALLDAPTLRAFSDHSQSDPETSVLVLRRPYPAGEMHFYVLLRPGSQATGNNRVAVQDLLSQITVLPGEAVATGALIQLPIVLNSLVGAELFDPAAAADGDKHCNNPQLQSLARTVKPLTNFLSNACAAVGPALTAVPEAITAQLPSR
jgi:hypothetical protein